ncbi:MAG TPA: dienelactone hydrolase family protein [Limnochordia bacterium]|nr:dienelactone hydrolase family protein [Limnochordia bacterium]
MQTQALRIETGIRPLDAHLAIPAGQGPFPAILVIQEVWGLTDHIKDLAERFAKAGYVALAPDLYTGEHRAALTPERIRANFGAMRDPAKRDAILAGPPSPEQETLQALMGLLSPDGRLAMARALVDVLHHLRRRPDIDGTRTGSIGFCMGGALSGLLATLDPDLRAAAIFYGDHPPLDQLDGIRAALFGAYGETDHRLSDPVPAFAEAMQKAGKRFDYKIYAGAGHAFFNDDRPDVYNVDAARDAWVRVLDFFNRQLS